MTDFITRAKTDPEFMAAWNASGRQYGDHELENVYLGWRMREAAFSLEKTLDDAERAYIEATIKNLR